MTYSQAQIDRLAKVMEDYVFAVQGERYGQRQAAVAQASQIPRMTAKTTGNLVLDWATVTWEFVRGNRSQIGADFCMNLMLTEKAVVA